MKLSKFIIKVSKIWMILLVPIIFLVVGIATLGDYGFNWDEPIHFMRGQAYFHFLTTGNEDYSDLEAYPRLSTDCPKWIKRNCYLSPSGIADILESDDSAPVYQEAIDELQKDKKTRRSFFQFDTYPYSDFKKLDEGHPPVGGILAALTNDVFYQRLGIMGDLESHHLAEVLSAFLIVLAVALLVYKKFGIFASVVASFVISSYPLFFSESHFNIKDPMLASFYGLTIIFLYLGITKRKVLYILSSSLFLGLATGVKFNTLFLPLIIGPWFLFYFVKELISRKTKNSKFIYLRKNTLIWMVTLFVPLLAFGVFFSLWPFLWENTWSNIDKIFGFYKQIGVGTPGEMASYLKNGWNTYPVVWIIYTTPIPVLVLTFFGFIKSTIKVFRGDDFSFLVLLWIIIPILRVSWPNTTIYGGVRQIMEYVPPMAILSGIGALWLIQLTRKFFRKKVFAEILIKTLILLSLFFVVFEMVRIHPNQNVYFNQLIGGIRGARERNIPYWGNTYGNVYLQGVEWLNENAEPNAKLGLAIATMGNVPRQKLRADIKFFNGHWSGTNREGEYEMEMDFEWFPRKWYSFQYMETYLEPVYVAQVDGVPLLKIWKNDLEHTKKGYEKEKVFYAKNVNYLENSLQIDIGEEIFVTSLKVEHSAFGCDPISGGHVATSLDGVVWDYEADPMVAQVPPVSPIFDEDTFIFLFPARKARYITVEPRSENSCLVKSPQIEIKGLDPLK
ncbi:glycosyltransferase family 39 protein [Candidatus Microgenomates bacterium]|nr:glycosyltransferase family 39 protein [Candidatus Microgenomates bacterium]